MNNEYEKIIPWNGANDTGRDARLKLERNFDRVRANFEELTNEFAARIVGTDDTDTPLTDDNTLSSLRILDELVKEFAARIIALGDGESEFSDENTLSALRIIAEIKEEFARRIVKVGDTDTPLTDENTLSALRVIEEILQNNEELKGIFLRKDIADETKHKLTVGELLVKAAVPAPVARRTLLRAMVEEESSADETTLSAQTVEESNTPTVLSSLLMEETTGEGASTLGGLNNVEAAADDTNESDETLIICKQPGSAQWVVQPGYTKSEIDDLLFPAAMTATINKTVAEWNVPQTITVGWSIKQKGEEVQPDELTINGTQIDPTTRTATFTGVTATTVYTIISTLGAKTLTQKVTVTFVGKSYYGVAASADAVTAAMVAAAGSTLKNSRAYTYNNIALVNQVCFYAYPATLGALTSIKDGNNFEYLNSYVRSTIEMPNGLSYYLYVLRDPTTIDTPNYKHIYA